MSSDRWEIVLGIVAGLLVLWTVLVIVSWRGKPDDISLRNAMRLLPDLIRLLKRLAADSVMPRGVRIRLALLLGYLALPIDLVPDFIPVLGYADDAVVVALMLRSVTRRAGPEALERHWPGTTAGPAAVRRLCGLPQSST